MRIGAYLKEARKVRGLTQGQVARRLRCSDQYVSNYEKGLPVSDKHLKTLISLLNLEKNVLMAVLMEETEQKLNRLYQDGVC